MLFSLFVLAMFSLPMLKEESRLLIPDDTIDAGGSLVVVLTDKEAMGLSNATINIKLADDDGVTIDEDITTDSKGKAKLDLDLKKGKYNVTVIYAGNENYTGNNRTQKLTIKEKEKVVEAQQSANSASSNGGSYVEGP